MDRNSPEDQVCDKIRSKWSYKLLQVEKKGRGYVEITKPPIIEDVGEVIKGLVVIEGVEQIDEEQRADGSSYYKVYISTSKVKMTTYGQCVYAYLTSNLVLVVLFVSLLVYYHEYVREFLEREWIERMQ